MTHWITLTADMLTEAIDRAELEAITAADTDGTVIPGIIQDVTAAIREAIAGNAANVMDLQSDSSIPRTLKPEALDMIAWRLLKRFAVMVSEDRDKANTAARERLEAVRADALDKSAFLLDLGLNVNLAPVCDVSTDPADFIYARAFGQDAQATAEYADTVVSAMGEAGIGSVLKHFPGYGSNRDTHTGIAVDQRPLEQFRQSDFLPFQAGIDAGAGGVLVSHNIVTCLDPELPASLSPASYQVLREELGFEGVAMTDDLDMDAVQKYVEEGTAPVMALQAGADLVLTSDPQGGIPSVLEAVETGALTWDRLDQSVLRVLRWKLQLGLLSLPGAEDVQTS